jgi:hypothetical protein
MTSLEQAIMEQIGKLSEAQQQRVLDYLHTLTSPEGVPGKSLLRFAGSIPLDELKLMEAAIEEAFEQIEPDEW